MTTNGRDWKFKNRVKKMLAEKIGGDTNVYSKNRKKLFCNFGQTSVGVLKIEEIVLTDDEASNTVANNDNKNKAREKRKMKSEKKKNKLGSEILNKDNIDTTISKKIVREKRRRIETAKNLRKESISKKGKTISTDEHLRRSKLAPKTPSNLNNEVNSDEREADDFSSPTSSGKKMKFGEPTIIKGSPKNSPKFPLHNSPVSNLTKTSITSNLRGNILSNFFSRNENPRLAIFQNAAMTANSFENYATDKTDETEKNDVDLFNESLEHPDCDSDISFISNDDKSDSNFCSIKTSKDLAPVSLPGDPVESEYDDSKEKPEFYSLQNKVIAIMSPSCKFHFNGKLKVKVLIGKVEIYGFVFGEAETVVPAEIYSPRGSSLVSIETVEHESSGANKLYSLLTNEGIDKGVATDMQNKLNELPDGHAVLILENLENTLTKYLDFYYPLKIFPKSEDSTNYHNRHPKKAEKLLQAIFHSEDLGKQLKKDDYRESNILKKFQTPANQNFGSQRILISGGKGVGKSTTLRYFVNGLLPTRGEIVVIDFDPGQPEFTPPGCISLNIISRPLTGPNYTHLKTPFHQLFIGDVNVARCVPRYVKAARKLVDYLNESPRLKGLTVLVNTMGFCTGIGWDLMVYIIRLIHPSTVVQITSERSKNNFRYLLSSEVINDQIPTRFTMEEGESSVWEVPCDHELHVVPSLAESKAKFGDSWEMEPRQQRDITLLAYLSKIPRSEEEDEKFLFSPLPRINDTIPYSVPMSNLTVSLIRTMVPASHILATMNGNIVALCGVDATDETPVSHSTADFYPKTLLRAPLSPCYGFGIVRGVDMEKGKIFINTPLSIEELEHANCLIGSIPLPMSLISSNLRNAPYIGEGVDLPTSREPRRGYFRMRRRNSNG